MRTTPVPQSSDNDTCCREDMTETGLKVFQLQSDSAMSAKLRDDKDGHMFGRAHLLVYNVTFVFKMTEGLQSHTSTLNQKRRIPGLPFCFHFHFCSVQIGFYFIFGKSLTHTAAKLAVGTNIICLIVGSAWKETQWAQTACRSLHGPVTQRTDELTQGNKACSKKKKKVNKIFFFMFTKGNNLIIL